MCLETYFGVTLEIYTAASNSELRCVQYDMTRFDEAASTARDEGLRGSAWYARGFELIPLLEGDAVNAVGITRGPAPCDKGHAKAKTLRESCFPVELVRKAFNIRVQSA